MSDTASIVDAPGPDTAVTEAEMQDTIYPNRAIESARTVAQKYVDNPTDYT